MARQRDAFFNAPWERERGGHEEGQGGRGTAKLSMSARARAETRMATASKTRRNRHAPAMSAGTCLRRDRVRDAACPISTG